MANASGKLKPNHYKALELFEEGMLNIGEIGDACGISRDAIYNLFEGNIEKQGEVAALFKEELQRITARTTEKIREMTKDTKKLAIYQLNSRLRTLNQKKRRNSDDTKEITSILNAIAKSTAGIEIGSFSITKGMNPEEIRNEFKRLRAIARSASQRGRILPTDFGESGEMPPIDAGRDSIPEE